MFMVLLSRCNSASRVHPVHVSHLCRDFWGPSYKVGEAQPIFSGALRQKMGPHLLIASDANDPW